MIPDLLRATRLHSALDAVVSIDGHGRIVEWNRAAEVTFGHAPGDVRGRALVDVIVPPAARAAYAVGLRRSVLTGGARALNRRLDLEAQRADGEVFPCEVTIHAAPVDGRAVFAVHLRDITERVRTQARQAALYGAARNLEQVTTPEEVVQVILREVLPAARATLGSIGVLGGDRAHVQMLGQLGYEATVSEQLASFPLTRDLPASHVVRTGEPVFGDRAALTARFRDLAAASPARLAAAAVLPLNAQGRVFGYLALVYDTPQAFETAEQQFVTAMAEQCALALNRAQLLDMERWARGQMTFLAEAGATLSSSLDVGDTLGRLAGLVVPRVADWCAVYVPQGERLHPQTVAHTDPARVRALRAFVEGTPTRIDGPGPGEVFRTGTFSFVPAVTPQSTAALALSAARREQVAALGLRSYMAVPMVAHGRPVGVMAFATAESGRTFTPEDLNLALELGRRAGLALDHSRLHGELRASHATLEQRVEERTRELERRSRELERSNAELERFAFVASHDLQEPLRTIASFSGLIERRYAERLDERGVQYLTFMVQATHRLKVLIDDLLVFSRLNAVRAPLTPVPLAGVLGEALDRLAGAAGDTGATVTAGELPVVLGVHAELVQVFQNVVGNALKFHAPGVAPVVTVSARRDPAGWEVRVQDNGIGFEPEYAERIFQIFQRLHGRDEYEGTGMGLAIVRKIVEQHHGRIWASAAPGGGSCFHVLLLDAAATPDA